MTISELCEKNKRLSECSHPLAHFDAALCREKGLRDLRRQFIKCLVVVPAVDISEKRVEHDHVAKEGVLVLRGHLRRALGHPVRLLESVHLADVVPPKSRGNIGTVGEERVVGACDSPERVYRRICKWWGNDSRNPCRNAVVGNQNPLVAQGLPERTLRAMAPQHPRAVPGPDEVTQPQAVWLCNLQVSAEAIRLWIRDGALAARVAADGTKIIRWLDLRDACLAKGKGEPLTVEWLGLTPSDSPPAVWRGVVLGSHAQSLHDLESKITELEARLSDAQLAVDAARADAANSDTAAMAYRDNWRRAVEPQSAKGL